MKRLLLAFVVALLFTDAGAEERSRVAVFDFELLDTSLQGELRGPDPAEAARLARLGQRLREWLTGGGRFELIDIAPVAAQAKAVHLGRCADCAVKLGKRLEARLAVVGLVQKVSELILNLNVHVYDVATGRLVVAASADIRANTDESWRRGLDWLIRHRLAGSLEKLPR